MPIASVRAQEPAMNGFLLDLRHALRMLGRRPAFSAVAIATVAIGIGATTAVFSVVDAVLLRPLRYPHSERLVILTESTREQPELSISMADLRDWIAESRSFDSVVGYRTADVVAAGGDRPERLRMRQITSGFFPAFGVRPIAGRPLTEQDDRPGAAPVTLLSERYWQKRFARDPGVIGRTIDLDGTPHTVIGVLPDRPLHGTFRLMDVFSSLWRVEPSLGGPSRRAEHRGVYAIARLKPGVTVAAARGELSRIAERLARQYPDTNAGHGVQVQALLSSMTEDVRPALLILLAVVGVVLVLACANTAHLLLARATERGREIAVRLALGARAGRLLRLMLTESLLLALIGGAVGTLLAIQASALVVHAAPPGVPRLDEAGLNGRVLAFALALCVMTGIGFGLAPAIPFLRRDVAGRMRESGPTGTASRKSRRLRGALIGGEVLLSVLLLVGAGLLARSFENVLHADPGFDPTGVYTAGFSLPADRFGDSARRRAFVDGVLDRLRSAPGVQAAGLKTPLFGGDQTDFAVADRPLPAAGHFPAADTGIVTPDALRAMGLSLRAGRYFDARDADGAPLAVIVDTRFAETYWPKSSAVGKRLLLNVPPPPGSRPMEMTIVGVVSHVKNYGVDQPSRVEMYAPYAQFPELDGSFVVRMTAGTEAAAAAVRSAVHAVDPTVALYEERSLPEIVASAAAPRRLSVILIGVLAAMAVSLATIGIYGVMSYVVTQRRREIGIRIALGANESVIFRLIVGEGVRIAAAAAAAGLALAAVLAPLVRSQLFGVSARNPVVYLTAAGWLVAVALAASYVPARRAMRLDPLEALRTE
jgi:putative ABC transport system permease protein